MELYASKYINESSDPSAAQELLLFIENDGDLYRQQYSPINKNLTAKKASGKYNHDLAAKLFEYLVESGAKKYYVGSVGRKKLGDRSWSEMFPKALRAAVAKELRDKFEEEYALFDEFVPKKYRAKVKVVKAVRKPKRRPSGAAMTLRGMR